MTETDLAYFAGIFDGEGCVSIASGNGGATLTISVQVCMYGPVCQNLMDAFPGGGIYTPIQTVPRWTLTGRACKPFLEAVLPYLRVKKRQAEIGLAFIETIGAVGTTDRSRRTHLVRSRLQTLLQDARGETRL